MKKILNLIALLILVFTGYISYLFIDIYKASKNEIKSFKNGKIIKHKNYNPYIKKARIEITNKSNKNLTITLIDKKTNKKSISIYIHGKNQKSLKIPIGKYIVISKFEIKKQLKTIEDLNTLKIIKEYLKKFIIYKSERELFNNIELLNENERIRIAG